MKILAVDTSAVSTSVALCDDEFLLGEFFLNIKQTHSETLMPEITALLKLCTVDVNQIGLYAVANGPGSFTGVRIGVACIKGMALPNSVPCAPVSPLETAAMNIPHFDGIICAAMDARRGQVYNALFEACGDELVRLTPDRAISIETLRGELKLHEKNTVFVGDGADLCYNELKTVGGVRLAPENLRYQRASGVARIGLKALREGKAVAPNELKPFYLRPTQAERELKKRLEDKLI